MLSRRNETQCLDKSHGQRETYAATACTRSPPAFHVFDNLPTRPRTHPHTQPRPYPFTRAARHPPTRAPTYQPSQACHLATHPPTYLSHKSSVHAHAYTCTYQALYAQTAKARDHFMTRSTNAQSKNGIGRWQKPNATLTPLRSATLSQNARAIDARFLRFWAAAAPKKYVNIFNRHAPQVDSSSAWPSERQ